MNYFCTNTIQIDYNVVGWSMLFDKRLENNLNELEKVYQKIVSKKMTIPPKFARDDFCYQITDDSNWVLRYAMITGRADIVKFALSKGAKLPKVRLYIMDETTPEIKQLLSEK